VSPVLAHLVVPSAMLLMALMFHITPHLSRPEIFFAVTVAPGFRSSPPGRAILARFRLVLWLNTAAAVIVAALLIGRWPFIVIVGSTWQLVAAAVALVNARRHTLPYAQPSGPREIELLPARGLQGGAVLQLLPFALIGLTALYVSLHWDAIPDRFPIHWDATGRPNGWGTRSFVGVFAPAVISAAVCAAVSGLYYAIAHKTRGGSDTDRRMRNLNLRIVLGVQMLVALTFSWTMMLPVVPGLMRFATVIPTLVALFVVSAIAGGLIMTRRLKASGGDFTPDACWKGGGMFYYNPDDPAIFVVKRFGIGYTLNFGNRWSWLWLALLMLPGLTIAAMTIAKSR